MRRPVPDALLHKRTTGIRSFTGEDKLPASRDVRYDVPCSITGYDTRRGWSYSLTPDDDPARASYVDALLAKVHH